MRLRGNHPSSSPPEPSAPLAAADEVVEAKAPVPAPGSDGPWSVAQLHALGPVTGPNHRTSVPIVRGTAKDNSTGDVTESSLPQTELTFIAEGVEGWTGRDSL